ncbi:MAG TPA: hypothetical protein PK375_01240 [Rhodocyclaceae bacterium]|nr:hypothetical protein [Rhodocyclaceae bacterium]HNH34503.1 hypothetical protein [Rhodocyclaceae bacterium]
MKKLGIAAIVLGIVAVAAFFWLRGNLDSLVKDAIEKYGSEMAGVPVRVASVEIKPGNGIGVIRGLSVGNPAGFKTPHALKVGEVQLEIDVNTLVGEVVTIRRIVVVAPDVIYEKGETATNFDAIQKHVAEHSGPSKSSEGGKKLIVDLFAVRDAKAQASAAFMDGKTVAVSLPDITLHDIGRAKGGITPGELGQEITKAMKQRLAASISFDQLLKSAGKGLDKATEAVKGLFGK